MLINIDSANMKSVCPHPNQVDGGVIPKDFHSELASSRDPSLHILNNKQLPMPLTLSFQIPSTTQTHTFFTHNQSIKCYENIL